MTVTETADFYQPVSVLHVPSPISWADEERDLTAWMGNELQTAAVTKLYSMSDRVGICNSDQLMRDWVYLQSSDHFYYMSTKFFSDGAVHAYFNPYENPYQAFMNYMNVLSDFEIRLNTICPVNSHEEEVAKLEKKAGTARLKSVRITKAKVAAEKKTATAGLKSTRAAQTTATPEKKADTAVLKSARPAKSKATAAAVKKAASVKKSPVKKSPAKAATKKSAARGTAVRKKAGSK